MAQKTEAKKLGVGAAFRKAHKWYDESVGAKWRIALEAEKAKYARPKAISAFRKSWEEFHHLVAQREALTKKILLERSRILSMWAQKGVSRINGVSVEDAMTASVNETQIIDVLQKKFPHIAKSVTRTEVVLDLEALLILADQNTALREVISSASTIKVTVSVSTSDLEVALAA